MAILLPLSLTSGLDALSLRDLPEVPISWMSKRRPGPSGGYMSRVAPAGSECGGLSSGLAVWRCLAASCSCLPVSLRGLGRRWGGRDTVCSQSRDAARAAGRSSGCRGQGPAGSCSPPQPRSLSAISHQGWGCLGGMTLEKLEQSRTRHLSVPCGHSDTGGGVSVKESLACQGLCPGADAKAREWV